MPKQAYNYKMHHHILMLVIKFTSKLDSSLQSLYRAVKINMNFYAAVIISALIASAIRLSTG